MRKIYLFLRNQFFLYFPVPYQREGQVFIKYIIAGTIAAVSQLLIFYMMVQLLGIAYYLISTTTGFIIAVLISFSLHKFWTFRDNDLTTIKRQFPIFFVIALANLFLNGIFMYVLVDIIEMWYLAAQVLTMGVLAFGSFILNRAVTFNNGSR